MWHIAAGRQKRGPYSVESQRHLTVSAFEITAMKQTTRIKHSHFLFIRFQLKGN